MYFYNNFILKNFEKIKILFKDMVFGKNISTIFKNSD